MALLLELCNGLLAFLTGQINRFGTLFLAILGIKASLSSFRSFKNKKLTFNNYKKKIMKKITFLFF
jgi:hypothetical protein